MLLQFRFVPYMFIVIDLLMSAFIRRLHAGYTLQVRFFLQSIDFQRYFSIIDFQEIYRNCSPNCYLCPRVNYVTLENIRGFAFSFKIHTFSGVLVLLISQKFMLQFIF